MFYLWVTGICVWEIDFPCQLPADTWKTAHSMTWKKITKPYQGKSCQQSHHLPHWTSTTCSSQPLSILASPDLQGPFPFASTLQLQ